MSLLEAHLDNIGTSVFGRSRRNCLDEGICIRCDKQVDANSFKDKRSKREYQISAFCQECQDELLGGGK